MIESYGMTMLAHNPDIMRGVFEALLSLLFGGPAWLLGIIGLVLVRSNPRPARVLASITLGLAILSLIPLVVIVLEGLPETAHWLLLPGVPGTLAVITLRMIAAEKKRSDITSPRHRQDLTNKH